MSVLMRRRGTALAQAATGAVLVVRPDAAITVVSRHGKHPASWIVRVLGARMLGQGCAVAVRPTRTVVLGGVAVDLVHAASMVWIAGRAPQYRRPAQASALAATGFAAAGIASAANPSG